MANLYQDILKRSADLGLIAKNTVDARSWLRDEAQNVRPTDARRNVRSEFITSGRALITIGRLYMFMYDPKTKDNLPYYDTFPVVFPFQKTPQGFMGINMHYLPPMYRAKLMDSLYLLVNNERYDDSTRLQKISYDILSSISRFRYFKPCLKHYLYNNIKSRFIYVHPEHWEIALFLPLERFKKATTSKVHQESVRIIKGNR